MARMQFAPEELEHFELVWENEWFRMFRVLEPGESPASVPRDASLVVWNRHLFTELFGDPLSPASNISPQDSQDFLYSTLWAEHVVQRSVGRLGGTDHHGGVWTERQLQEALRGAPYLLSAREALAEWSAGLGEQDKAVRRRDEAQALRDALGGEGGELSHLRPQSVPLVGQ